MGALRLGEKEDPGACLAIHGIASGLVPAPDLVLGLGQDTAVIGDVQPNAEGPGTVPLLDPVLGLGRTIAREHHPGVIPQTTAGLDHPPKIVGIGLNFKRTRKSSFAPLLRKSWSTGNGLKGR